jgi:hypothetical protein
MADDVGMDWVTTPQDAEDLVFTLVGNYYYAHNFTIPTLDDIRINGQPVGVNVYRQIAMLQPFYTPDIKPLGFFLENGVFGIDFDAGLKETFSQVLGEMRNVVPETMPHDVLKLRSNLGERLSKELLNLPTTFFHDVPAKKGYKPGYGLNLQPSFPGGAEYLKDYPKVKSDFQRHQQLYKDRTDLLEEKYNAEMRKLGGRRPPEALIEMGKGIAARKSHANSPTTRPHEALRELRKKIIEKLDAEMPPVEFSTDYRKPPPPPPPGAAGDGRDIKPKGYKRIFK